MLIAVLESLRVEQGGLITRQILFSKLMRVLPNFFGVQNKARYSLFLVGNNFRQLLFFQLFKHWFLLNGYWSLRYLVASNKTVIEFFNQHLCLDFQQVFPFYYNRTDFLFVGVLIKLLKSCNKISRLMVYFLFFQKNVQTDLKTIYYCTVLFAIHVHPRVGKY